MKAFLLHRERDFERERALPPNEKALAADLGLDVIFAAMAGGDEYLLDVSRRVVLSGLRDENEIVYRQRVLADCVERPQVVREIYDIAVDAITAQRKVWYSSFDSPSYLLFRSLGVLPDLVGHLRRLRRLGEEHAAEFRSGGFRAFFGMVATELDEAYLDRVEDHVRELRFPHGTLLSARLGKGYKGTGYALRRPHVAGRSWWQVLRRWLPFQEVSPFTLVIAPRDEAGMRALEALRSRGINSVANVATRSVDHILSFFQMIRFEVGFYLACLELRRRLLSSGEPVCFPAPEARGAPKLDCRGLYDVGLALRMRGKVVGNDVQAEHKALLMVTGANQGGKSTFLRSLGLAQLMMQAGMFVGADSYRADAREGIFTHFKREEDPTMSGGKLDEELRRASEIADQVVPGSLVLFNESFAATNEREGAEIAQAIVRALLEAGVKVLFVTHSYELARTFHDQRRPDALFLRAERRPDGERTFRQIVGEPLPTSYGEDLYQQVFGSERTAASVSG